MNPELLKPNVQAYLNQNIGVDPTVFSLKKSPFPKLTSAELAQQLAGRKKAKVKLPSWYAKEGILYPPGINLEQCSSEITGRYKAGLTGGKTILDLTGGFGVDSSFFSQRNETVFYCELMPELTEITRHNFKILGIDNIDVRNISGLDFLGQFKSRNQKANWIYADPSRRDSKGGRVIKLEDYEPNIPANLEIILESTNNLLLKTSPMLDLAVGINSLSNVREIHIVGVKNEVRELLWWIQPDYSGPITMVAIDLIYGTEFRVSDKEESTQCDLGLPGKYLYEPHAALMKTGAFSLIGQRFGIPKIHPHTHLFTSEALVDFPGKRFRILEVLPYKAKKLPFKKANIAARNFPESVDQIRKRTGIKVGGHINLFFVKILDESYKVMVTEPV